MMVMMMEVKITTMMNNNGDEKLNIILMHLDGIHVGGNGDNGLDEWWWHW